MTKQAFDKGELMQEITRTKNALNFANRSISNKRIGKENSSSTARSQVYGVEEVERSLKLVESIGI